MSYLIWIFFLTILYLWTARAVAIVDRRAFVLAYKSIERMDGLSEELEEKRKCLRKSFLGRS